MTNRDVVSRIRATHKLLGDASINDRAILAEARGVGLTLLNQKTNSRKLWNTDTVFTPIPCLEMISVPIGQCCTYSGDRTVSRSKHKLPSIADGNYQYLIQGVYDVASTKSFLYTPINRFLNILKLGLDKDEAYYWIHNGYLYLSSPFVQTVKIVAHFTGDIPYEILYPECDCEGQGENNPCTSRLDEEFKLPGNLIDTAVKMTSQMLLTTYFQIPDDHTSDDKNDQTNRV